ALALLIYLAATRQVHSRDSLAALFWPESDQKTARASLRRTFYVLIQGVDKGLFMVQAESIALAPSAKVWSDVEAFQRGVAHCLSQVPADRPSNQGSMVSLSALVDLYSNDFLDGFSLRDCPAFDDWQFFLREELRR